MCRRSLLVVLWLLISTRSRLPVVGLLSNAEPLCPSPRCLFGTILVTLCLLVCDWWVSRAEPMLSCGINSSVLYFLSPTILSFSSFHGLVVWGWRLRTDRVFSLSPALALLTPVNNNNNNTVTTISGIIPNIYCETMHICILGTILYHPIHLGTTHHCNNIFIYCQYGQCQFLYLPCFFIWQ